MTEPLFIFSLPRSGSTLLQRILGSHSEISTSPETWLLLPLVYMTRKNGFVSEFGQSTMYNAIIELQENLPHKDKDFFSAVKLFADKIYNDLNKDNSIYFLDKTPRYYLIINDILKIFPNAKFIYLFRNPIQVISSIIQSWYDNRFRFDRNHIDIYRGPLLLTQGYQNMSDISHKVNFEDIITSPNKTISKIFEYLDLKNERSILDEFYNLSVEGKVGDQIGSKNYTSINTEPLNKWKETINSKYRKKYIKNYLEHIGKINLTIMGYDLESLKNEVEAAEVTKKFSIIDRANIFVSKIYRCFDLYYFKRKIKYYKLKKECTPFY